MYTSENTLPAIHEENILVILVTYKDGIGQKSVFG